MRHIPIILAIIGVTIVIIVGIIESNKRDVIQAEYIKTAQQCRGSNGILLYINSNQYVCFHNDVAIFYKHQTPVEITQDKSR